MYCKKCGVHNVDSAKFCKECGSPLSSETSSDNGNRKKTSGKGVYYIIGAIVLLGAVIAAVFIGVQAKKTKEYAGYLEEAEKYIAEVNYAEAKEYYLKAIEVAPKKLKPYVELAKVYMEENETEKAVEILKEAEEHDATDEPGVIAEKDEILETFERYKAYAEKIKEYEATYGAPAKGIEEWGMQYTTGFCYADMVDFAQTGKEQLLMVYHIYSEEGYDDYVFEVWDYQNEDLIQLDSGSLWWTDGGVPILEIVEIDGMKYIESGGAAGQDYYNEYHGFSDNGFGIVKTLELYVSWDEEEEYECYIDGEAVAYDEFQKVEEKWFGVSDNMESVYFCNEYEELRSLMDDIKEKLHPFLNLVL